MNSDNYLKFLYKAVKEKKIIEKTKIRFFCENEEIVQKNLTLKKINVQKFITEINLSDKRKLLILDNSLNALLFHTILIGEECELYEFRIGNEPQKYITEKKIFEIIQSQRKVISVKEVPPKELLNIKFDVNFKTPAIINNLKEYTHETLKIDFSKIHIIKSQKLEFFTPTINPLHLKLAIDMKIPIVHMIENGYIRDTHINIHDNLKHKEIIKPLIILEQKEEQYFKKDSLSKIYKDISTDYYLKINYKEIKEKLNNIKITNTSAELWMNKIKNINNIRLSFSWGKIPLPLWKRSKKNSFVLIKNTNHFLSITGLKFTLDIDKLEDLYIIDEEGKKGYMRRLYLKKNLEDSFNTLSESQIVEFRNELDFIIKTTFEDNIIALIQKEKTDTNEIKKLRRHIEKLYKTIVERTIELNKKPHIVKPKTLIENYLFGYLYYIEKNLIDFMQKPKHKKFLQECIMGIKKFNFFISGYEMDERELYFVCAIFKIYTTSLEIFDKDSSDSLNQEFNQTISNLRFLIDSKKKDSSIEYGEYFKDILTGIYAKRKHEIIIVQNTQNKQLIESKLNKFIRMDGYLNKTSRVIPNYELINRIFPYSSKQVANEIKRANPSKIEAFTIKIKNRNVEIKKDYYTIVNQYEGYKTIVSNKEFDLISKISANKHS